MRDQSLPSETRGASAPFLEPILDSETGCRRVNARSSGDSDGLRPNAGGDRRIRTSASGIVPNWAHRYRAAQRGAASRAPDSQQACTISARHGTNEARGTQIPDAEVRISDRSYLRIVPNGSVPLRPVQPAPTHPSPSACQFRISFKGLLTSELRRMFCSDESACVRSAVPR
jgi:hypothetical protein